MLGCKEFYDKAVARWAESGYLDEAEPVCMDAFCALLLAAVRYGPGRMEDRSVAEIGGQIYDRNFIAHNAEELRSAMGTDSVLVRELPSDMEIWAYYLFQKIEEVRI